MDHIEDGAVRLLSGMPSPDKVREMEAHLSLLPQVDIGSTDIIHARMCARTIFIPAGTMLTGALTNIDNICLMVGDITVTTDDGPKRLTGFHVLTAKAGFKRAGYAHADTYWTTIHHTDLEDISAIEEEMTPECETLQSRRNRLPMNVQNALEN